MEGKKISFGFMKTKKADKPIPANNEDKMDYIECVEEQSIKIVGGEKVTNNEPLVIPMKPNSLIKPERLREIALKVESALEEPTIKTEPMADKECDPSVENETLDQMAVRELMQDAKKEIVVDNPTMAIPSSVKGVADGEKESTLDDYESVPVQEFGVAMLRGMGWTPGQTGLKYKQPELRPKGLGLGADKVIKAKPQPSKDSKQEELVILKNSYVKIVCGKYSDYYGKVISLDEDNGRVMVDIPLKKETVSLTEFMMHAVTKSEYDRESKVINSDAYEEYKKKESSQKSSKQEENRSSYLKQDGKERGRMEEKENDRRDEQDRRQEKGRDRRNEKERDRRDEKERENTPEREIVRRPEKDRESRSERQIEGRDEREKERKDRQIENNDSRRRRDKESANGKSKSRHKRDSSSEDRYSKKKNKKRYSSSESLSSLSEDDRKRHKHSKNKSRRRSRSRSDSDARSPTPEAKRDIDKKRKGKKKKRDRDRSPNYRKHRK